MLKRGTKVHDAAEDLNKGLEPDIDEEALPYVVQYAKWLDDFKPTILAAEDPVYHFDHRYAGTLDGIAEIEGQPYLFDLKTTDKDADHQNPPPYPETALQMVAYARAQAMAIGGHGTGKKNWNGKRYYHVDRTSAHLEPLPKVAGAVCLVVSPTYYRLVPMRIDDEVWNYFLGACHMARWRLEVGPNVIGVPVAPPAVKVAA